MAEVRHHILTVLVENKAGVLTRVAGLFARRGFNIHSLAVAPTDDPTRSRLTMVVDVESSPLEQMIRQLDKLINVIDIEEIAPEAAGQRELLLVRVAADVGTRDEVIVMVRAAEGRVLHVGRDSVLVSLDDEPDRLDELELRLRPFGILAIQRTGRIALPHVSDRSDAPELEAAQ